MEKLSICFSAALLLFTFTACGKTQAEEPGVSSGILARQTRNPIVNIVDRTKTEMLPYDMAEEKFFEDSDNEYYFSGIYSHYVIVHYEDGSQEDIVTALNAGRATIADLDQFEVYYTARPLGAETARPDNGTTENIPSFSYKEINQIYTENDPGVKCEDFYNTSESEITTLQQVIDRAEHECTNTIQQMYSMTMRRIYGKLFFLLPEPLEDVKQCTWIARA